VKLETKQKIKQAIFDQIHANWQTLDYPYADEWARKPMPAWIAIPLVIGVFAVLIYGLVKLVQYLF